MGPLVGPRGRRVVLVAFSWGELCSLRLCRRASVERLARLCCCSLLFFQQLKGPIPRSLRFQKCETLHKPARHSWGLRRLPRAVSPMPGRAPPKPAQKHLHRPLKTTFPPASLSVPSAGRGAGRVPHTFRCCFWGVPQGPSK